jgi:hypothetical protein
MMVLCLDLSLQGVEVSPSLIGLQNPSQYHVTSTLLVMASNKEDKEKDWPKDSH